MTFRLVSAGLALAALTVGAGAGRAGEKSAPSAYVPSLTAARLVPLYGEEWWNHYHPDYESWYPGGRSNRFHDAWIATVLKKHAVTKDWEILNRDYSYDGQWFAVEWHYRATYLDDGFREWETTVGFGRIQDGKIILWVEYFDDAVGGLQKLGLMPLCEPNEPVAPWPAKATALVRMPYRP
jgi:hypothetical protein